MQHEQSVIAQHQLPAGLHDVPLEEIGDSRYVVRFAQSGPELDAVLRLRFEVFNLELGEGLAASYDTGRDEDEFDAVCRHLMVVERASGTVVGTYRLQTSAMAAAGRGFYSATEFDLSGLPGSVLEDAVELGRACIAKSHRNTRVLFLLWRGLAAYVAHNRKRYLFGCCSLTSQDPAEAGRVLDYLASEGHMHPQLVVSPHRQFECLSGVEAPGKGDVTIPRLFGIYLRYGAAVCGAPAIDRAFGTIDFFVLFDVDALTRQAHRAFFGT
jgi:putative hemolysin